MADTPRRKKIPDSVKLAVALRMLGHKDERGINWSHEPALQLRAIKGKDYDPPQLDPNYLFIRSKVEHDQLTFKDNGTGRGDIQAIAHVKRASRKHHEHGDRLLEKQTGEPRTPYRPKQKIRSRGFDQGHRPLRSRNTFQRRQT